jgi:hypothetical protein
MQERLKNKIEDGILAIAGILARPLENGVARFEEQFSDVIIAENVRLFNSGDKKGAVPNWDFSGIEVKGVINKVFFQIAMEATLMDQFHSGLERARIIGEGEYDALVVARGEGRNLILTPIKVKKGEEIDEEMVQQALKDDDEKRKEKHSHR